MIIHRLACAALPATCVAALYFRSPAAVEHSATNTLSTVMITTNAILAMGVVYTRYWRVDAVAPAIPHAPLLRLLNVTAILSANLMLLCFLLLAALFLFKVNFCSTMGDIFVNGFGTLYIWMQCILNKHMSSLYNSKNLTLLRRALAALSCLLLIVMILSGIVANIFSKDGGGCLSLNIFCGHLLALIFCIFLMTFDSDHKHLNVTLQNDLLLDDRISVCSSHISNSTSASGPQHMFSCTYNIVNKSFDVS